MDNYMQEKLRTLKDGGLYLNVILNVFFEKACR